jgi:predicted Zn-dependent protease
MSTPSETSASGPFAGSLSDGTTPTGVPVGVSLTANGLEITTEASRRRRTWRYGDLYSSTPLSARSHEVVLNESALGAETLFVADPGFARALLERATSLGVLPRRVRALVPGVVVMVIAAMLVGVMWIAGFDPAKTAARALPDSARSTLGRNIIATLSSKRKSCETDAARVALDRLTARLAAAAAEPPVPVHVVILDWGIANAFAAPGGQLILTRGLVEQAGSSDEVAGVLAHEIGHALELHPEASLVRGFGLSTGVQLVLVGAPNTLSSLGVLLTQLRYSRIAEREADTHALRILKAAGISAAGFGAFFARLNASRPGPARSGKVITAFDLVRTHPLTAERLALVAAQPSYPSTPALSDADFRALRSACTPSAIPIVAEGAPGELVRMPPPAAAAAPSAVAEKSETDRVIDEASNRLASNSNDMAALQTRAKAYTRKGQYQFALEDYTQAVALKPGDAALHFGRAGSLQSLHQYEAALTAYDEVIRLQPTHVAAFNGRGNCNRALKRYESALVDFDEAIRLDAKFAVGYYNRAVVYHDLNRTEEAMRDFSAAIAADKDYAGAYVQRGRLHEKAGSRELAIADFRAGLAAPPKFESGPWAHRTARERLTALGATTP